MTTIEDVRAMFRILALELPYRDGRRWALVEGSKTYGRPFVIVSEDLVTGGRYECIDIGWTKDEADRTMEAMRVMAGLASEE